MNYDGGKNADGVFHTIINQIPPHNRLVELFAGSAAITRRIRPALANILIEKDPLTVAAVKPLIATLQGNYEILNTDALRWLDLNGVALCASDFIYADPPYLRSVRSCQRDLYNCEFATNDEHAALLWHAKNSKALWLISGYDSELYRVMLHDWRLVTYTAQTRGGPRTECLWANFPDPVDLHDYGCLGKDRTDRQRIKRKMQRWASRLRQMPALERNVIFGACDLVKRETSAGPGQPGAVVGNVCEIAQP
jgi:DNA adenine methylase